MRVLYVNWVDYLDAEARGGGVSLYQRNLMAAWPGDETLFLACGTSYDLPGPSAAKPPRWEPMRHGPVADRARRFEIVNSGVMAPGHASFGDPAQIGHGPTEAVFFDFLARNGPFDVVHFNNLEGLPAGVLRLKDRFPGTRVILSLHNYYPVCPQVNLWQRERAHCTDFEGGAACVTCLPVRLSPPAMRLAAGLSYRLKCAGLEPGSRSYDWTVRLAMGLGRRGLRGLRALRRKRPPLDARRVSQDAAHGFAARRRAMVETLNAGCDVVLCVSEAVRKIAVSHGIEPDLARTCYIGTVQADVWQQTAPRPFPQRPGGPVTLAYLGYMRRDKGFFFLLDALEAASDDLLSQLHLVVGARRGDPVTQARLMALRPRLARLDWHDGYSHDGLDALLAEVDVGLIPPLWADNLPQVAIEMHSRHIPLLCSDRGGAQELAGFAPMVFPAGDGAALRACLAALVAGEIDMEAYWRAASAPVTMPGHLAALETHYRA